MEPNPKDSAADRLRRNKPAIPAAWEKRVRSLIPQASGQPSPILMDTTPQFLDNLAEALTPGGARHLATEGCTLAQEHGGERARITRYPLEGLFTEFRLLRETVFELLFAEGHLTDAERAVILNSMDDGLKQSALAYTIVLESIREQFLATLSHDLRGPLTAAKASVEMILRYPEKRDHHSVFAVRAVDNLVRADRMNTDLLDVTRIQAGEALQLVMSECDPAGLVKSIHEELTGVYGARLELRMDRPERSAWLNPDSIRRVLENLVNNAFKYGGPHTPVVLRFDAPGEGRLAFTVRNDGPPIAPEDQETLFLAYKRARSASSGGQRGWGLGLALVRGVAEAHGGSRGTTLGIDILQDARSFRDNRFAGQEAAAS